MKLDFCLPSPKSVCGAKLAAHYELRNARKADISGKSEFEHAKTTEFHEHIFVTNSHGLVRLTRTRKVRGTLFRIMQRFKNSSSY